VTTTAATATTAAATEAAVSIPTMAAASPLVE